MSLINLAKALGPLALKLAEQALPHIVKAISWHERPAPPKPTIEDTPIRWKAGTSFGEIVEQLAQRIDDLESEVAVLRQRERNRDVTQTMFSAASDLAAAMERRVRGEPDLVKK